MDSKSFLTSVVAALGGDGPFLPLSRFQKRRKQGNPEAEKEAMEAAEAKREMRRQKRVAKTESDDG